MQLIDKLSTNEDLQVNAHRLSGIVPKRRLEMIANNTISHYNTNNVEHHDKLNSTSELSMLAALVDDRMLNN